LGHFLCFSLSHLNHILGEYVRFCNVFRPHHGVGNQTLTPLPGRDPPLDDAEVGPIRCRRFLGGLLRHYYRAAA
jgi:putative transposase